MRYFLLSILLITVHLTFANPPDTLDHFPVYRVENGAPTFYRQISETLKYPRSARQRGTIGTAVVSFLLSPSGAISDFNIVNSIGETIDQEIIEAFQETADLWLPDCLEENNYILFFPVIFLIDEITFTQTKHEAGFMLEKIMVTGYSGGGRNFKDDKHYSDKAIELYQKKDYKKAIQPLDELIRRNPFNEELYKMRGYCRYANNDRSGACEDYQKIQTLLHKLIPPAARNICFGSENK